MVLVLYTFGMYTLLPSFDPGKQMLKPYARYCLHAYVYEMTYSMDWVPPI